MKFIHIVNPFNAAPGSDISHAQPITFESLETAKNFIESSRMGKVKIVSVQFAEDRKIVPNFITKAPDLERSVLDLGSFQGSRKLPLVSDIFKKGHIYLHDIDYVVYTNIDISIMPYFYTFLFSKLEKSNDASLIINRRTLNKRLFESPSLSSMYSELGEKHPGYDCFVFHKSLLSKFILLNTCIGANWFGRVMYSNLLVFSHSLEIIKDAHLTFHIGDDGIWMNPKYAEFDLFNKKEAYRVVEKLQGYSMSKSKMEELESLVAYMDGWGKKGYGQKVKSPNGVTFRKKFTQKIKNLFK